jgi:hypothetical protein
MTATDFRRLALSLPDAEEHEHMGHPDFRVRGRIFATLGYPDTSYAMVSLNPEQQHDFVRASPQTFVPVKGGWGRKGATQVVLEHADEAAVERALRTAWENRTAKPRRKRSSSARS